MRPILIALSTGALLLAGCDTGPRQVQSSPPTVTYAYNTNDNFDDIQDRADEYCDDNFDNDAILVDRRVTNTGYEAVFVCE